MHWPTKRASLPDALLLANARAEYTAERRQKSKILRVEVVYGTLMSLFCTLTYWMENSSNQRAERLEITLGSFRTFGSLKNSGGKKWRERKGKTLTTQMKSLVPRRGDPATHVEEESRMKSLIMRHQGVVYLGIAFLVLVNVTFGALFWGDKR